MTARVSVVVGVAILAAGVAVAGNPEPQPDTDRPVREVAALMDPGHGQSYALAFGDSYFTGSQDVTQAQTFGRLALNSLGYSVAIRGHGATGYVTGSHIDGWPNYVSQVSDDSLSNLPTEAIKVIVLEGGINDAIVDVDPRLVQLNANWVMRTLRARYPDAVPVALGVTPDESGILSGKRLAITDAIARAAAAAQWRFIDARSMITPDRAGQIIGADRLHPTPAGHRLLAAALREMLVDVGVPAIAPPASPLDAAARR
ncbi:SGNH/GDSL hydrolase family protein [Williamsia sp.]|uniref:SGNH/GDSL hydrolase family protein n=1 Tax=Williamsia sp. TaxID=1872085 RepID=UPI001A21535E|nr:SGNH/GDSL hydrolase family protein [Williamsia sp.]MBJ7289755.1 SGNH/GDSL hydrolase family protein [Williamsia sp.]